jgi:5S rRNA maturation endonuclease (ribonuclease M5)
MIQNITDLERYFPNVQKTRATEWHSPCPFCTTGELTIKNNVSFYGRDRLIWFLKDNAFVCRQCKEHGRGRNKKGYYSLTEVANFFGESVSAINSGVYELQREEVPLRNLWTTAMVEAAHAQVDRPFFYRFGWTDATIDRFKLGKGRFRGASEPLHIIPMRIERIFKSAPDDELGELNEWYIATRGGDRPYRSSGSVFNYWSLLKGCAPTKTVLIAEGEKDAISLTQLFPTFDVVVAWGASSWSAAKTEKLAKAYDEIVVFGDNDEAGAAFNEQIAAQCAHLNVRCAFVSWPEGLPAKCDVTDILAQHGTDEAARLLQSWLTTAHTTTTSADVSSDTLSIDVLRDENDERSLYRTAARFLERREPKSLLLLASPPGAGKTYALARLAEHTAQKVLQARAAAREALEVEIAQMRTQLGQLSADDKKALEQMERRLENFSNAEIAWFGRYRSGFDDLLACGISPDLWFNYEARNEDNCRNYTVAAELGQKNHDVGQFCALSCPYRDQCLVDGYLAQDEQRKAKPITFFRHEHLLSSAANVYHALAVVDENACGIYDDNVLTASAEDLLPHAPDWLLTLQDISSGEAVDVFARALRLVVSQHDGDVVSGSALFNKLDAAVRALSAEYDLTSLVDAVNESVIENYYHPNYVPSQTNVVKKRCLLDIYRAIRDEMPIWTQKPHEDTPSRVHLTSKGLEVYIKPKIQLLRHTPLIVADATALPELYGALFKRSVEVYQPRIFNPNARIIVVRGSDYTKTAMRAQLGDALYSLKRAKARAETLLGEALKLDDIVDPDVERYHSRMLYDARAVIEGLSEQHSDLLVVTHKDFRELLALFPWPSNVHLNHYGALRGTNAYEHCDAVLLIGAFRVPYDVLWRKICAWAVQIGDLAPIPRETVLVETTFPNTDVTTSYRTFAHPFADRFVWMVEAGEMIQSADRIRPHSSHAVKHVYVLANRPALLHTTQVVNRGAFFNTNTLDSKPNTALNYVLEYMERYYEQCQLIVTPTYRDLAEKFKMSNRDIAKVLKDAKQRFEERLKRQGAVDL